MREVCMDVVVSSRHCEVSDRFREHVSEKLTRLEKHDHRIMRVQVEVELEKNPDIIADVDGDSIIKVGFAAETESLIEHAQAKLSAKQASALKKVAGVVSVEKDLISKIQTSSTPDFMGLTGATGACTTTIAVAVANVLFVSLFSSIKSPGSTAPTTKYDPSARPAGIVAAMGSVVCAPAASPAPGRIVASRTSSPLP